MKTQLEEFRNLWLDQVLTLLWGQWDALGVRGTVMPEEKNLIDPEALLLLTASMGRWEARLFDEVLDWMRIHERLLNISRLQALLKQEPYSGGRVVAAMATHLRHSKSAVKWDRLGIGERTIETAHEPLFYLKNGDPLPIAEPVDRAFAKAGFARNKVNAKRMTQIFDPERPANLVLRLRALFGVNSRAEAIAFLASHPMASVSEVARHTGYQRRTMYNTLVEMSLSGCLTGRTDGGENRYRLNADMWRPILGSPPPWRNVGALFGALDHIWQKLRAPELDELESLAQASELLLLVRHTAERVEKAGFELNLRPRTLEDDPEHNIAASLRDLQHILDLTLA